MNKARDKLFKVRIQSELLIKELQIDALPIDPMEIAQQLGIELKSLPPTSGGASGMFFHYNGEFCIAYPSHINNKGYVRFSIAHEIGHYRLPGHIDAVVDKHGKHVSYAGFQSNCPFEREADYFASCLLMPTRLFKAQEKRTGFGLKAIKTLAKICVTSLEATAIRYVETSNNPLAVIRSEGQSIDYAYMSKSLKDFPKLEWLSKDSPLPIDSITSDFNMKKNQTVNLKEDIGTSALQDWFDCPPSTGGNRRSN
ncbi:MAG: ImmA/IrrE family metallo-endopeptidase [Paracoccaceae bacterium]|nr:ImmA/IrrE family metallo-endopeptidase [Paracoccaceae bacterium]MDE2674605.1 ImmA/IrrE family metallo-endopeptidase [Paracoccaceae bacterium]